MYYIKTFYCLLLFLYIYIFYVGPNNYKIRSQVVRKAPENMTKKSTNEKVPFIHTVEPILEPQLLQLIRAYTSMSQLSFLCFALGAKCHSSHDCTM